MAMCPGVTDTPLISEAHHRQLQEDWGDEAGRELDELPKQKRVFKESGLSYIFRINMVFLDTVAVNFYSSAVLQGINAGYFMLGYLTTVFQICRFRIVE
jgi:hypothetical protein